MGRGLGLPPHPRKPPAPPRPFLPTPCARGAARGLRARGRAPGRPLCGPGGGRAPGPPPLGTPGSANPVGRDPQPPAPELWDPWDPLFGGSGPPGLQTQGPQDPGPAPWSCSTYGTWQAQVCKQKALGTPRFTSRGGLGPPSPTPHSCRTRGTPIQGLQDPKCASPGGSGPPGSQTKEPQRPRASPRPCPQGARHHLVPQARGFGTLHTHNQGEQDCQVCKAQDHQIPGPRVLRTPRATGLVGPISWGYRTLRFTRPGGSGPPALCPTAAGPMLPTLKGLRTPLPGD